MEKVKLAIVGGSGWRGQLYANICRIAQDRFELVGMVVRNADRREEMSRKWGVPCYASAADLLREKRPDFFFVAIPAKGSLPIVLEIARTEVPILLEIPPAEDLEGLIQMHRAFKGKHRIQLADQYMFHPYHSAITEVIRSGKLGDVHYVHVSTAHGYHGVSIIRHFLNAGMERPELQGFRYSYPMVKGQTRQGPPQSEVVQDIDHSLVHFRFTNKRYGLLDFTFEQYRGYNLSTRILVRGTRGEINNMDLKYLESYDRPIHTTFVRQETGRVRYFDHLYLQRISAGDQIVYTNPYPYRLNDDEIAMATCMGKMANYIKTGEEFYPLDEALHDAYLDLMAKESTEQGKPVQVPPQPWCA